MKKTRALEEALLAVRRTYPKLNIENCMSGGQMINALTDGISQSHWIRDGKSTGMVHARSNIKEALGAAYFLPLAKIQRWTNRPDQTNPDDAELLKFYCRSVMIGVWGISGDLTKLTPRQRQVMLAEVERYRRLNEFKPGNLYRIIYPEREISNLAGIVLYDLSKSRAAVILFRWIRVAGRLSSGSSHKLLESFKTSVYDFRGVNK
ncbi:MAG: alpha-galactosidase [Pirellulales bacterium]|nr:alpha-galactosidase [Pirellulales bacterium]